MTFRTNIHNRKFVRIAALLILLGIVTVQSAHAAEGAEATAHGTIAFTFLWIAVLLLAARFASLVERLGQPAVLGELVIGVILGNLVLLNVQGLEAVKGDATIRFLSELGVVVLLFQVGLESNVQKMFKIGIPSLLVATVGVVVPFILGTYLVGPYLLPGQSQNAYLFLGAALTATSVGITARVFRDLGKLQTKEAQIVLGAAVIDDVMGLIILAVVSAIATAGVVSVATIGWITAKALLFLVGSIVLGQLFAPRLGRLFSIIHTGVGMKFTLAICFCLLFAALAQIIGLAPIVGAFAAGLVLDPVHFKYFKDPKIVQDVSAEISGADPSLKQRIQAVIATHADRHIEELIEPVGLFLVPLFFIMTGMAVRLETMFNLPTLMVALAITFVAVIGKICAGIVAGRGTNRMLVGWGMVPRGEVGLIFASIGKSLGVVSDGIYSVIVIVVILTTLITPPILTHILRKKKAA